MKKRVRLLGTLTFALLGGMAAVAVTVRPAGAQDDPWAGGSQWLTLRGGYAKSSVEGAGDGGLGYGIGYSRMLKKWKVWHWTLFKDFAVGAHVHHEMIGKLASASQVQVPVTVELVRHFDWHSAFHPYAGFGTGPIYRKLYRTGDDQRSVEFGYYVTFGGNVSVSPGRALGADVRILRADATNIPANPVFGLGSGEYDQLPDGSLVVKTKKGTHWSVKLGYSLVY